MPKNNCLLLIFIKNPLEGKVKTRLGATIGHPAAVSVYKKLLTKTREAALAVPCDRHLYYGDYINNEDEWKTTDFEKYLQVQGNLGDRMRQAFKHGFESGYKKVMIIGSDCPEMNAEVIQNAFDALSKNDAAIGPALDGGYYLLGMSHYLEVFSNIAWSTETVFEDTQEKLKKQNASIALMPSMSDLDTIEDLKKYPHLQ